MEKELLQPSRPLFDRRMLFKLIVPIMAEQLLAAFIGMADTLMVANCGEEVVSGVALVDSISMLLVSVFTALSTGGAIVVSQYIGRGERDMAKRAANQVFLVTLSISVVIAAVCLVGRGFLLRNLFGHIEPEVYEHGVKYFLYLAISYPFLAQFNTCAAIFRADGNSLTPMLISLGMNALNVGGNAIFIYGFGMAAAGAGLASMISRIIGFALLYTLIRRNKKGVGLSCLFKMRAERKTVSRILRVGIPTGFENGIFQIGKLLVQGFVTSYGTMHIAANAVSSNMSNLAIMMCASFGLAMTTVVGQCMGAGEKRQARGYVMKMTGCAWIVIAVLAGAMLLLRGTIGGWYNLSGESAQISNTLILISSLESIMLWPPAFLLSYGMRSAGDVRFSMITSITSMWVFRVGLGYVLGSVVGMQSAGVLLGMGADWLFRACVFSWRFFSGRWMTKKVI